MLNIISTREIQIKTTVQYYSHSVEWLLKKSWTTPRVEDIEKLERAKVAGWNV